jgi:uncharacterized tellurite resistance protein B-like protein
VPIVAVILLTLVFWTLYWFVRMGGIDHFRARSAERKEEAKRAHSRERAKTAPLRAVDDPREAATILMLLIPRGGDPTPEQLAAIEKTLRTVFGFDADLTERVTQARFLAGHAESFEKAAKTFSELFQKRLTIDERQQLVAMVEEIARLDGPSRAQTNAIHDLERRLGIAVAR